MSLRKLKYHEKKLLKKVDFLDWKTDDSLRMTRILRRYHIQKREDYIKYNRLCGLVRKIALKLKGLDPRDPYRVKTTEQLINKLYNMGLVNTRKSLQEADKLTASSFCRRRLPVVMVRLKMSETLREAVTFIEQGHVRVGPETITDPAFLVTRSFEDHVTWVDSSKIKKTIMKYNDKLDDFVLLGN
mmetsp:Transcript_16057/g.28844  ORF Transcript_16057/g.28844 Transcript_16057/m.28844 type:complete len:186 (-) Transcript_16057:250-807(-)|eukprot:CAMPEP_0197526430 /NCGR_PEP_ID=MMETSP1318-20131121/17828_1 /TAXON_ID=552666 /ORGANISM="Partenskyella glossopodia, Strain RCC365" /LENGTH=185 /DNA_ID=CAMNT_0043080593 /DNA_START=119 /DNA_END=676 /DNA_ORIENTATION=-